MLKMLLYPTNFHKLYFLFRSSFKNLTRDFCFNLGYFQTFCDFLAIFLLLINSWILLWFESILCMICILLNLWGPMLHELERTVSAIAGWNSLKRQLDQLINSDVGLLHSCCFLPPWWSTIVMGLPVSLDRSVGVCLMCLDSAVWSICREEC